MRRAVLVLVALVLVAPPGARAGEEPVCGGPVDAFSDGLSIVIENGCARRAWDTDRMRTRSILDQRTGWEAGTHADFRLEIDGVPISSDLLPVATVDTGGNGDSAFVEWRAPLQELEAAFTVVRRVEMYRGIAGFRSWTSITSTAPASLSGYTLDQIDAGPLAAPEIHAFHAGADWREPGWSPSATIGDPQTGDWHEVRKAGAGESLAGTGELLSLAYPDGQRAAMMIERRDYASSVASYDGSMAGIGVDFSRDVVYFGPLEENAHAQNPGSGPARHRALVPGRTLALEPSFTILGRDADDEAWQLFAYLTRARHGGSYNKAVAFNTDGVDSNKFSTGAKDDATFDRFLSLLPAAREMGADTFVFDDGWMARSGDWCPDSPECPEPRKERDPAKFGPRFHDDHFGEVQELLRGDPGDPADDIALGLWMTPMNFHPSSRAYQTNPQWACAPVGHGTAALSIADPNSSSNEPGIGVWNPLALGVHPDTGQPVRLIDYIEDRILRAIEVWGVSYFKFDFLVWIDCAGAEPTTMYEYHDAFVEMLDRVQAKHPGVTLQIDETNDYRMFPFESTARGPAHFLNGSPSMRLQLHTAWSLAPYVPGYSIGGRVLKNGGERGSIGIDKLMAAAITSHITFSNPIDTDFTPDQRAQIRRWTDFYRAHRDTLATFSYPLLTDPNEGGWTVLQPWDLDARSGWLLAYRQGAENEFQSIPLRGLVSVPDDVPYRLTRIDPASGVEFSRTFTAGELRAGLTFGIGEPNGYVIERIEPA